MRLPASDRDVASGKGDAMLAETCAGGLPHRPKALDESAGAGFLSALRRGRAAVKA